MEDNQHQFNNWIDAAYEQKGKCLLLLWAIALLAANPRYFHLLPLFPLGFLGFVKYEPNGVENILGWIAYLVLSLFCLNSRTRTLFLVLVSVLTLLLLLNVVGCHMVQSSLGRTH